jgi:hypothetical protein
MGENLSKQKYEKNLNKSSKNIICQQFFHLLTITNLEQLTISPIALNYVTYKSKSKITNIGNANLGVFSYISQHSN